VAAEIVISSICVLILVTFTGSSEQQTISRTTTMVLAIFFLSLLGIGMGRTAVDTLGIPYIDDNVATRESPTYFGELIGHVGIGSAPPEIHQTSYDGTKLISSIQPSRLVSRSWDRCSDSSWDLCAPHCTWIRLQSRMSRPKIRDGSAPGG
jgi:Organic Anion Transporter Polypeptide (OATP) family